MNRVIVIGGGIAGLSAAWHASARADVTLIEKSARLGGKILTADEQGFLLEAGPDSFLSRKTAVIQLSEELGIAGRLVGRTPRPAGSFIAHRHALFPLPEGFTGLVPSNLDSLVAHPLLSEQGRQRALREPTIPPSSGEDDESIAGFMTRRFGEEVFRYLIEPMVSGIHSGDPAELSLEATFPGLRALERSQGRLTSAGPGQAGGPPLAAGPGPAPGPRQGPGARSAFVTFPRGTEELVRALTARLDPGKVIRGTQVRRVSGAAGGLHVELDGGGAKEADAVVIATPAPEAARLLEGFDPDLAGLLGEIDFASSAVIHLAWRASDISHPLDGYGYVIPRGEAGPLIACTWTSRKWEGRAPAGMELLRLYAGGSTEAGGFSNAELIDLARGELAATLGIRAEPVLTRVHRWIQAMPRYTLGHPRRLAAIQERLARHPGLLLAGASYRGVGIPDCIASGRAAAESALVPVPEKERHHVDTIH